MASLEKRSVSNLIEVMADERWKRLAEQQGVAYAKTVAEAMKLKLDMVKPADREKLRGAVLDSHRRVSLFKYCSRSEPRLNCRSPTEIRRNLGFFFLVLPATSRRLASCVPDHLQKQRRILAP